MIRLPLASLEFDSKNCAKVSVGVRGFLIRVSQEGNIESVFLDQCAHMGSPLEASKTGFTCKTHGWVYDHDGQNLISGSPSLQAVPFTISSDFLELNIEPTSPLLERKGELVGDETLDLLSHASFLLRANERSILFDPWLVDSAYWGSWSLFPNHETLPETLEITDLVITHPHPDHFHIPTLKRLRKDTRVFIPNFESGIMQAELKRLGFTNVQLVEWEAVVDLDEDIQFAFLRPVSLWEDSSCLVRVKNWIWLNQNDSGAPLRDELLPDRIDLLSTSFDIGASGYPLTWAIPEGRKAAIISASKRNLLETIFKRCEQVQAAYYSPFAGWWRHGHSEHQEMASMLEHTTFEDLRQLFQGADTKLVETIPSSKLVLKGMDHIWDKKAKDQLSRQLPFASRQQPARTLTDEALVSKLSIHLDHLNSLSLASASETVAFEVSVPEIDFRESRVFGQFEKPILVTIRAQIPSWVAEVLVSDDITATWNHMDIGYWIRWERNPDVYPANFMRLLQLGRADGLRNDRQSIEIDAIDGKSIAELMEVNPELATSILSRAGLPCGACTKKNSDSLGNAFAIHRVPEQLRERSRAMLSAIKPN